MLSSTGIRRLRNLLQLAKESTDEGDEVGEEDLGVDPVPAPVKKVKPIGGYENRGASAKRGRSKKPAENQAHLSEYATRPELEAVGRFRQESLDYINDQIRRATKKRTDPFGNILPHISTIQTLAEFGSPAKGEYKKTKEMAENLFGHDPDGMYAWMGMNGIFSPNTAYLDHASAATMITAAWLAAGKPKDEATLRRMFEDIHQFGKRYSPELVRDVLTNRPEEMRARNKKEPYSEVNRIYSLLRRGESFSGTTGVGSNIDKAIKALQNVDKLRDALLYPQSAEGKHLELLGGKGLLKVPNFTLSYVSPEFASALDMHMGRLAYHPTFDNYERHSNILSQVKAAMAKPEELTKLEKASAAGTPIKSDLIKALMPYASTPVVLKPGEKPVTVLQWLKGVNGKLNNNPAHYMAYKHVIAQAAKNLGWTPAEVQESVWTGVIGLLAANAFKIPPNKIQEFITNDLVRQGWQNHEAFAFPGLLQQFSTLLRRGGTSKDAIDRLEASAHAAATKSSVGGAIPVSNPAHLGRIAAYLPAGTPRDASAPIRKILRRNLESQGLLDKNGKFKLQRLGIMLRLRRLGYAVNLGRYDRPTNFNGAETRAVSTNTSAFINALKDVLLQAGIHPELLKPAVHDVAGNARVSVLAAGKYADPNAPNTAAAWTGLLGRQPGMVAFTQHPQGADSIYSFFHHKTDHVRTALDSAGILSRTFVPEKAGYRVYIYDKGRQSRAGIAKALHSLGVQADEWTGYGNSVGGNVSDMGRSQYRDQINQSESMRMDRNTQNSMRPPLRLMLDRLKELRKRNRGECRGTV